VLSLYKEAGIVKENQKTVKIEDVVSAMGCIVGTINPLIAAHQVRVTGLACAIAAGLNLPEDIADGVKISGILHDIGYISTPMEILGKPGRLNEAEFSIIRAHPKVSFEIIKRLNYSRPVAEIVLQHHEKIDGSGYPRGIKDKDILLQAKILCVADVVEAMASHRPYRMALGLDAALKEISDGKGKLYDSAVVDCCLKVFKERNFVFP
jgi:putative two-component system response regulator